MRVNDLKIFLDTEGKDVSFEFIPVLWLRASNHGRHPNCRGDETFAPPVWVSLSGNCSEKKGCN